ncbi:MAG: ATP-binding protein [Planctomycetota bacterium]
MKNSEGPGSEVSYRHFLEQLSYAIEHLDDLFVITDAGGNIEYVNPPFTRVSGYTFEEILGRPPLMLVSAEHDRSFYHQLADTIRQGATWKGRVMARWKDGTVAEQEVTIVPFLGPRGSPTHYVAVVRDRSERRELEMQLAQAQKLETVGILASNIAHDFNNLLTIIGGNAATTLEGLPQSDPLRAPLQDIQKASDQAAELTRDLLALTRRGKPRSITCNLGEVAAEALRLMRHALPAGVELRTDFSPRPLLLRGDPTQLRQVVVNLCMNARDALSAGGTLTLRTSDRMVDETGNFKSPDARPGEFVVLRVEDTGPGMEREVLARAFEPFFTTKAPGHGSGLGLAIVRNIIAAHHGWVEIESAPGAGTRVEVYFPSRETLVDEPQHLIDSKTLRGAGTVLVADDEPMIVALLRTVLESRGYQTLTARSAAEAVSLFEQHQSSLAAVVLDWSMPKVGGLSVLEQLRRLALHVPVVLISGSVPTAEEGPLPTDKYTRFVTKPFAPTDVLVALKAVRTGTRRSTTTRT